MSALLLVKWSEDDQFDHPIVDEQHRALIATINSLHYFIGEGWDVNDLRPTVLLLENYISFHFKTEELILLRKGLPNDILEIVKQYHETFLDELYMVIRHAIKHEQPDELSVYLSQWWLGHKSEFHEKLALYIKQ